MSERVIVNRPAIAQPPRRAPVAVIGGSLAALGLGVFLWLSEARAAEQGRDTILPPLPATATSAPPPLSSQAAPPPAQPAGNASFFVPASAPVTLVATPPSRQTGFEGALSRPPAGDTTHSPSGAPTLVVDMAQADVPGAPGAVEVRSDGGGRPTSTTLVTPAPGAGTGRDLSDTERFSARVGNEEVEVARAHRMTGLDRLVPQGAVVGAVMETALNSDLPGFARAVVQRDVRSFDGSAVLIPAGSRVIGQYKSGIAQGASRVFVLWTRLIRPDGVSIELASPATDDLGRGGIGGKVNRHFLQRFGGAILTTVLSAGLNAATARAGGSTIVVGSAGEASTLAGLAGNNNDIPPTITTRQGAAVRIFVARDLDFSSVGPAR